MTGDDGFTVEEIYDAMQAGADSDCGECDGDGYVTADCFEDTCCCADPEAEHGVEPCPICNPDGTR
jgi:hypothetical protein